MLIVGSGFFTHNLHALNCPAGTGRRSRRPGRAEFDDWGARRRSRPATSTPCSTSSTRRRPPRLAHPRTEHFAPLFVTLGAASDETARTSVDGFWYGLSKRSVQFG